MALGCAVAPNSELRAPQGDVMVGLVVGLQERKDGFVILVTTDPRVTLLEIWKEITSRGFLGREVERYKIALRNEGSRGREIYADLVLGGILGKIGRLGKFGRVADDLSETQKLLVYTGKLADHHVLPRQFEKFFKARGISIDDFTVSVDHTVTHLRGIHGRGNLGQMPGRWNQIWTDWIKANPNATATDVYQQAGRMMDDFGIGHLDIHPYGQ